MCASCWLSVYPRTSGTVILQRSDGSSSRSPWQIARDRAAVRVSRDRRERKREKAAGSRIAVANHSAPRVAEALFTVAVARCDCSASPATKATMLAVPREPRVRDCARQLDKRRRDHRENRFANKPAEPRMIYHDRKPSLQYRVSADRLRRLTGIPAVPAA